MTRPPIPPTNKKVTYAGFHVGQVPSKPCDEAKISGGSRQSYCKPVGVLGCKNVTLVNILPENVPSQNLVKKKPYEIQVNKNCHYSHTYHVSPDFRGLGHPLRPAGCTKTLIIHWVFERFCIFLHFRAKAQKPRERDLSCLFIPGG